MDILDTTVRRELTLLTNSPAKHSPHRWKLTIRANGRDVKPLYVKQVTTDRHYHKSYAETLSVIVGFVYSDYQYLILPYKDTLEATLIKTFLDQNVMAEVNAGRGRKMVNYKAQLMNGNAEAIGGDNPATIDKSLGAKSDIAEVEIQIFSRTVDALRKKTWGTTARNTDALQVLGYALLQNSKEVSTEASQAVLGVHIDPTFDETPRDHLIIRPMPVVDIPLAIDRQCGGLHPAQMRYFLQGQHWYVYPLYDHSRFNQSDQTLTIIKIPKYRMPGIEKTFRMIGKSLIVFTTNATKHQDQSEAWQLNNGNGSRYVDADHIMNDFVKVGDNKAVSELSDRLAEVTYQPRADEMDMISSRGSVITNNYNDEYAKMALASGGFIQAIWDMADIDMLIPGMPVRYLFQDGEMTRELYGTLNAIETLDHSTNTNISDPRFVSSALLTFFVSSKSPMQDPTKTMKTSTVKST